jgi:hypothetical protein
MATIINFSINLAKVNKEKLKDGKYLNGTLKVEDKPNDYGQNVRMYHSQTKEEREGETKQEHFGNGKVVWTDGNIEKAPWKESITNQQQIQNRAQVNNKEVTDLF